METSRGRKVILIILILIVLILAVLFLIPKTGFRCLILGHDHNHKNIKRATCTSEGVDEIRCSRCGKVFDVVQVKRLDHNYVDGICTVCGEKEPTLMPEVVIDITPNSGTKPADTTPYVPSNGGQGASGTDQGQNGSGENQDTENQGSSGSEGEQGQSGNGAYINEKGEIVLPELP